MKSIGIFVDVVSIYFTLKNKSGRKLNYKKMLTYFKNFGEITQSIAYGTYSSENEDFIDRLKKIGFFTKFKKQIFKRYKLNWHSAIAVDVFQMMDNIDIVVFLISDPHIQPLISFLRSRGLYVIVMGANIHPILKANASRSIEIPPSLLENQIQTTEEKESKNETT